MEISCSTLTSDGSARVRYFNVFFSLLGEIKIFLEERGEDTTLLSDAGWVPDLAFLTDVTEKMNDLNIQLQGKEKDVHNMISAVNAFSAKPFSSSS